MLADERHAAFKVTWSVYQDVIDAYQAPDPAQGNKIMARLITSLQTGVPAGLEEVRSLGRTMKRRRDDILAFFRPPRHLKTAPPKPSVSLGSAGLGLAGQDGVGRVDRGVTLEAIGPLAVSFR